MSRRRFGKTGSSLMEYAVPLVVFFGAGALLVSLADVPGKLTAWMADSTYGEVSDGELNVHPLATEFEKTINNPRPIDVAGTMDFVESFGRDSRGGYSYATREQCFETLCLNLPVDGIDFNNTTLGGASTRGGSSGIAPDGASEGTGSSGVLDPAATGVIKNANVMKELAAALAKDPNVPASVVDQINALALQGQDLARAMVEVQSAGGSPESMAALNAQLETFNALQRQVAGALGQNQYVSTTYPEASRILTFEAGEIAATAGGVSPQFDSQGNVTQIANTYVPQAQTLENINRAG